MKKILAIVSMAAMVAGAAFADPSLDDAFLSSGFTFGGSATTTWGADLDQAKTGFQNKVSLTFKVPFLATGSYQTSGEGIWAELVLGVGNTGWWSNSPIVNVDGATVIGGAAKNDVTIGGGNVSVGIATAKLHFYDFYVGLLSGDTTVGELKIDSAIRSNDNDNAKLLAAVGANKLHGLTFGYGDNENIGVEVDFRSASAGDNYYNNDYGIAAEIKLLSSNKVMNGAFSTVGASYAFNEKALALAGSAGYKLKIDDTFYVQPTAGYTASWTDVSDISANDQVVAGGILLGWGATADANAGVYYLDNDTAKKVTPGFGVVARVPLTASPVISIAPSFYTGSIVPNLTAAAYADIAIPTDGSDVAVGVAGGLKYALSVSDSVTVTPQVGARFATKNYGTLALSNINNADVFAANTDLGAASDTENAGTDGLLNIKGGIDVSGLINNTTFSVWYQSRNLLSSGSVKVGTINVAATISF